MPPNGKILFGRKGDKDADILERTADGSGICVAECGGTAAFAFGRTGTTEGFALGRFARRRLQSLIYLSTRCLLSPLIISNLCARRRA